MDITPVAINELPLWIPYSPTHEPLTSLGDNTLSIALENLFSSRHRDHVSQNDALFKRGYYIRNSRTQEMYSGEWL